MSYSGLFLCLAAALLFATHVVDLSIKENAGIRRINENITMGVPLPENSLYTDVTRFKLEDGSGQPIPCEIQKISNWHKTPQAIRWLRLDFPFSLDSAVTKTVTLSYGDTAHALPSKLTVQDSGNFYEINTGKIRFHVRKSRFNLLDQVWIDESGNENYSNANQVVSHHNRGIIHYLNNTEYLSSNDSTTTVVLEHQGTGTVTLKASGYLKNSAGAATFYFVTRLYAYDNSSCVKIQNTLEFRNTLVTQTVDIQGIHLEIPLTLGLNKNSVIGKPGGFESATLSGTQHAFYLTARPSGSLTTMGSVILGSLGGAVPAQTFNPKALKPKDIGWAALSDGYRGCVVALKYFWQSVPTSVEAFADGKLVAAPFSKRSGQIPLPVFAGTARTSETQWTFFNQASTDTLRSMAAACTDRLFALASPFWYTRRTLSAVPLTEIREDLYTPANWAVVSAWDAKLSNIWEALLRSQDMNMGYDSYGFLEWGDNPLYAYGLAAPCDVMWNGNYYGLDFFAFEHFYHTGDSRFLDFGIAHARHVQDVHQLHFGSANPNTGSSRYCPPVNHIATDNGQCTPDFGNMSHHKSEGLFMDFYLTGNDYALQCALEAADWSERSGYSYAVGPSDNIKTYVRRWAHQMFDMVWAYEYNQAPKYYQRLWQNWEMFRRNIVTTGDTIGQPFMVGLGMEAVVKMHGILSPTYKTNTSVKPDSIAHYLKIWCDTVNTWPSGIGSENINSNVTLGYAFLSRFYGDGYLATAAAKAQVLPDMPANLQKFFPQQARNMEMAMYYYAIPESVSVYRISTEQGPGPDVVTAALVLEAIPNPFNPTTTIRITGKTVKPEAGLELKVYDLGGRLIKDLSPNARMGYPIQWNAGDAATNLYVIRCRVGQRVLSKRVVLIR